MTLKPSPYEGKTKISYKNHSKRESNNNIWEAHFSVFPRKHTFTYIFFLFKNFYLKFYLLFFQRGRQGEREGERHWSVASLTLPDWGPYLKPRHVPWPGIELATFCFVDRCPANWATPVRATYILIHWTRITHNVVLRLAGIGFTCKPIRNAHSRPQSWTAESKISCDGIQETVLTRISQGMVMLIKVWERLH